MGFLSTALIVGVVGAGAVMLIRDSIKEAERKATPCNFDNGISQTKFNSIIEIEIKKVDRIESFSINETTVRAWVRSQSGMSEWRFKIDFNDYGKITGNYWLTSKNTDSKIPESIAENIKKAIQRTLDSNEDICDRGDDCFEKC